MSDYDPYALGAVPTGRRLDEDTGHPKGWFGLVSMFPQASPQRSRPHARTPARSRTSA